MERRGFLELTGTAALAPGAAPSAFADARPRRPSPVRAVKPRRLRAGDVAGLVAPASRELRVRRRRDRAGGGPRLRPRAAARDARARPARLPGGEGRGPRRRRQPLLRRPLGEGRSRHPGRLGLRARPPPPRLGRRPREPEGRRRLQRHHRPALRPAGEDRPRHLPRAQRAQLLAAVLRRPLPSRGLRGRGGHDGQPAGEPRTGSSSARTAPARSRRPGPRPTRRRQPHRPHRARGVALRAAPSTGRSCSSRTCARRSTAWTGC